MRQSCRARFHFGGDEQDWKGAKTQGIRVCQVSISYQLVKLVVTFFTRAIYLEPEPFSPENDLLTPTFKPKRPQLKNRYEPQIAALYKELDSKPKKQE